MEHLICPTDLENILDVLKSDGIFAVCTSVFEQVPKDPNWHYLLPVHCTMWTNQSMQIVFDRYNFKACSYNVEARTWLMFKDKTTFEKLKSIRDKLSGTWLFSDKFVDYWKVAKPYRPDEVIPD